MILRSLRHPPVRPSCFFLIKRAFHPFSLRQNPGISDTIQTVADSLRRAVMEQRPEQSEGVPERGLRMLVFGKPGSGKVSCLHTPILSGRTYIDIAIRERSVQGTNARSTLVTMTEPPQASPAIRYLLCLDRRCLAERDHGEK